MIEKMFPENESCILERGTVFISDGKILECSVEPDSHSQGFFLAADYHDSFLEFEKVLEELKSSIEKNGGVYDIECEIHDEGEESTCFFRHPEYGEAEVQPVG